VKVGIVSKVGSRVAMALGTRLGSEGARTVLFGLNTPAIRKRVREGSVRLWYWNEPNRSRRTESPGATLTEARAMMVGPLARSLLVRRYVPFSSTLMAVEASQPGWNSSS